MTIVSTKEFNTNQKKYFDMAVCGDVLIRNDNYLFHLLCKPSNLLDDQAILQPDDDLRRAITKEELLKGIYTDISKRFAKK